MVSFKQKYILYVMVLFLFACNHPTEIKNYSKVFPIILESDIDYAIVKPDGTLWTWGGNSTGQLGNGTMIPSEIPKQIPTLRDIVTIDLVEGAVYAADSKGNIWFWGFIGSDSDPQNQNIPHKIENIDKVKILHASATGTLLFMKCDSTYWSYDIKTKETRIIQL